MTTPANLWDRPLVETDDEIVMDVPFGKDEWIWAVEAWKNGSEVEKGSDRYKVVEMTLAHVEGDPPGVVTKVTFRRLTIGCDIKMVPGPAILISATGDYAEGTQTSPPFGAAGFLIKCVNCDKEQVVIRGEIDNSRSNRVLCIVDLRCTICGHFYRIMSTNS